MENLLMARIEDINLNSQDGNYEDRYGTTFYDFAKSNGLKLDFSTKKTTLPNTNQ